MSFQFAEENDVKAAEEKSNTTVQIEEDGPSETFKDEESKVRRCPLDIIHFYSYFIICSCRPQTKTKLCY